MNRIALKRGTVPYWQWRDGRPRWEPGPKLRDAGFRGFDLKDESGAFLGLEASIAAATRKNAEVAAWRASGKPRAPRQKPAAAGNSVAQLWIQYEASRKFQKLAASTKVDYRSKGGVIRAFCGDSPVKALSRSLILDWWEFLVEERGLTMANGTIAVLRAFLSFCMDKEAIAVNPALKLGLERPAARVVLWENAEIAALVAVADAAGEHGLADAIVAALHTGQRQGDVLALPDRIFAADRVALTQSKTKAKVDLPMTEALKARVRAARARLSGLGIVPKTFVVDDRTRKEFEASTFRHRFGELRAAVAGRNESGGRLISARLIEARGRVLAAPLPDVAQKLFLDLRDTAVTRLYLARVPILEIAAITGHSPRSIHTILKHYVALNAGDATAAIAGLEAWLHSQGVAL